MAGQQKTPPFSLQSSAAESTNPKQSGFESEAHVPVGSEAMVSVGDVSHFADVDWERSLRGRLEDVVHYGLTFLPHEELYSLAVHKPSPKAWPIGDLPGHLSNRLKHDLISRYADSASQESRDLYLGYADGFSIHICRALQYCYTQQEEWDKREGLWVYAPRQTEPSTLQRLPNRITDRIEIILEMLRKCLGISRRPTLEQSSLERDQFEEDARLWVANQVNIHQPEQTSEGVANAERKMSIIALNEEWRREGYHEHLLRRYVWYRMIKEAPCRQYEVNFLVSQLFDKPWETRRWNPLDDRHDDSDLRIHYAR
ncbi:hypothetical protein AALT_g11072 [Alternaria alternata]|nr:hypothetical protein AALT_g11072 [Alternaria alternata]